MNTRNGYPRIKFTPLTIKEPYKPDVRSFSDPTEFNIYYDQHKEEFDNVSTVKLNRTYKIPGYRIRITKRGKEGEELQLVKDYYGAGSAASEMRAAVDSVETEPSDSNTVKRIELLESKIHNIEAFLSQLGS